MANVAVANHPLIGTRQTYRPDLPDARHLPAREYVARNGDEVEVLAVFHDWNGVEGLTIFYVSIPATGNRSHFSERELGLTPYEERPQCTECGDGYNPDDGCPHDHQFCRSCLKHCPECRADLIADHAADTALGT